MKEVNTLGKVLNLKDDKDSIESIQTEIEPRTIEEYYEKYKKLIFHLAMGYVHRPEIAEEVMQEVLLTIQQKIERINEMSMPERKRYICGITRNVSYRHFYAESRQEALSLDDERVIQVASDFEIDAQLSDIIIGPQVDEYIRKLSDKDSLLIQLVYGEKAKTAEIAQRFGITEEAVRKRLSRARKKLVDLMKADYENFRY